MSKRAPRFYVADGRRISIEGGRPFLEVAEEFDADRVLACLRACEGVGIFRLEDSDLNAEVRRAFRQNAALLAALAPLLCAAGALERSAGCLLADLPPHLSRSVELNAGTLAAIQSAVAEAEGETQ